MEEVYRLPEWHYDRVNVSYATGEFSLLLEVES